jgi:hypothetical protein
LILGRNGKIKSKKRFGRLKNSTYLCKTNNGGRNVRVGDPTPRIRKTIFEILRIKFAKSLMDLK